MIAVVGWKTAREQMKLFFVDEKENLFFLCLMVKEGEFFNFVQLNHEQKSSSLSATNLIFVPP